MISERTKSILLLTSYLSKDLDRMNKPLSISEWNRLVRWFQPNNIKPEDFLTGSVVNILKGLEDKTITIDRVSALLDRKSSLAIALDKWVNAGVWIISRGDSNYPKRIKKLLKEKAPPVFFGVGNIKLLQGNYVGMVGARNTSFDELGITKEITENLVKNNIGVVSGGARGVDETAMVKALELNGKCIGILADSLIKKSTSSLYRKHLLSNNLVLISPYNPEAGFNVGNAMGRNKLIYTSSIATIIIKSDLKGGTWEGAKENIKQSWVPLWVLKLEDTIKKTGNSEIVRLGGHWIQDYKNINFEKIGDQNYLARDQSPDLFSGVAEGINESIDDYKSNKSNNIQQLAASKKNVTIKFKEALLFDFFVLKLIDTFKNVDFDKKKVIEVLELTPKQTDEWLNKALANNYLQKKLKPVRYKINSDINYKIEN